jgi:hypothetical protein
MYCLSLLGHRVSQQRNQQEAGSEWRKLSIANQVLMQADQTWTGPIHSGVPSFSALEPGLLHIVPFACCSFLAGFLIHPVFYPEFGGSMSLQNIGELLSGFTALYSRRE